MGTATDKKAPFPTKKSLSPAIVAARPTWLHAGVDKRWAPPSCKSLPLPARAPAKSVMPPTPNAMFLKVKMRPGSEREGAATIKTTPFLIRNSNQCDESKQTKRNSFCSRKVLNKLTSMLQYKD